MAAPAAGNAAERPGAAAAAAGGSTAAAGAGRAGVPTLHGAGVAGVPGVPTLHGAGVVANSPAAGFAGVGGVPSSPAAGFAGVGGVGGSPAAGFAGFRPAQSPRGSLKQRILAEAGPERRTRGPDGVEIIEQTRVVEVPMVEEVTRTVQTGLGASASAAAGAAAAGAAPAVHYVDVPNLKIVEKSVEVPCISEIVKTVPRKEVVKVEREVFEQVPRVVTTQVAAEVETLGEIIEVEKPFLIENRIVVPRFVDVGVPVVVAQTLVPEFVESSDFVVEAKLREYQPETVLVDVFLPRPVRRSAAIAAEAAVTEHRPVEIPLAQYNALIQRLNREDMRKVYLEAGAAGGTAAGAGTADDGISPPLDFNLWTEHMLVPSGHAGGNAVPLAPLPAAFVPVPPINEDWADHYDKARDYIAA